MALAVKRNLRAGRIGICSSASSGRAALPPYISRGTYRIAVGSLRLAPRCKWTGNQELMVFSKGGRLVPE